MAQQTSLRNLFLSHVAQTSPSPPMLEVDSAEGIYIKDIYGKTYIDFISGIAVSNSGHRHPKVVEAIKNQADKYLHVMVYGEFIQSPQVLLAQAILECLPKSFGSVYFINSGSEASEGAMKLAKRFTGRTKMIAFRNAYHGSTQGALSLMGGDYFKTGYGPLLPDVEILEYNSLNDLERIDAATACVFAESIQGEAGALPPSSLWMQQLAARCKEQGALLVLDEIQSGFGRTGKFFAFEHYNVVPDIVLMAKGMGGGLPIGAFAASTEIMSCLSQNPVLGHITTFGGNALTAAAAHANLNVLIEEGHIEAIAAKEQLIRAALTADGILGIRGKGLMLAVEFNSNERLLKIMERCYEKGLITDWFLFADHCLRIAPPLIINETQINEACRIINEAVQETQQGK